MIRRGQNYKQFPLNIVGSSVFGRYPKINIEKTFNMFISDDWLVPYAGYKASITNLGKIGRAIHTSTKLNRMIVVVDNKVYKINIFFDQNLERTFDTEVIQIGTLQTSSGVVYIAENNKPQVVISDGSAIYYYDPALTPAFNIAYQDTMTPPTMLSFTPGFIDYHDTYILAAAKNDTFVTPPANNTWRLGIVDSGTGKLIFPADAAHVGLIQTKPDNTQAVIRFPSRGNMILVMGSIVTEAWFDVGYQLFPYQRNTSLNFDYGCVNPATIAYNDQLVVWLAQNEKSGPIIVYTSGGNLEKITTDGIDYLFSQLTNPEDSQAFMYRQDGHLFYHINFYTDNLSLFYDFNTQKFYHASDQNLNYFIAGEVSFFNNQYYFVTKNNGNVYAFDTIYATYDGLEIPRVRTCKNVRLPSQEYFIANDVGFTIEQGEIPYQQQNLGDIFLLTQDGKFIITQGGEVFLETQDEQFIAAQDGNSLILSQNSDPNNFAFLIAQQQANTGFSDLSLARVDFSISIDGGQSFSSDFPYTLNPPGQRKNRLMWWQVGLANDLVCQFKFWGLGRFVATDGIVNIRQ